MTLSALSRRLHARRIRLRADAYAKVLSEAGITAYGETRLD